MDNLQAKYYLGLMVSMKRKTLKGVCNNAKPLLLLAFFDLIASAYIQDNRICFDDVLYLDYLRKCNTLDPNSPISPIEYPFYYMRNDGFYKLHLVDDKVQLKRTPSVAYLRKNVLYAAFDDALWELLQYADMRELFRKTILNHYFNTTT